MPNKDNIKQFSPSGGSRSKSSGASKKTASKPSSSAKKKTVSKTKKPAYSEYKDNIEILAINDYNTVATIKEYPLRFADGLDVPLFAYNELNLS